ncbi:HigA family addiction module antitoxin [soil metagenome]
MSNSLTIIEECIAVSIEYDRLKTPFAHPGEHLREDFLIPLGLSAGALAKAMNLKDRQRIERLVRERQAVTADTALRLGRVLGTSAEFWINLQTQHDLSVAALALREEVAAITPLPAVA